MTLSTFSNTAHNNVWSKVSVVLQTFHTPMSDNLLQPSAANQSCCAEWITTDIQAWPTQSTWLLTLELIHIIYCTRQCLITTSTSSESKVTETNATYHLNISSFYTQVNDSTLWHNSNFQLYMQRRRSTAVGKIRCWQTGQHVTATLGWQQL